VPLAEHIWDDMKSVHAKFQEFKMHRDGDMNLCLFSFLKFCTQDEQELRRFDYMKDVVLDEGIPIKFISYISQLYFI
jgi:hypothetical protein